MRSRRDEALLCLTNEGELYKMVTLKLKHMSTYAQAAERIRNLVQRELTALKRNHFIPKWERDHPVYGDVISTYELAHAYLSEMEFPNTQKREIESVQQCLEESYVRYMKQRGYEVKPFAAYRSNDEQQETETMSKTTGVIDTITYIDEVPARDLSDDAIFGKIATLEGEIATLNKIDHKPEKLRARIDELRIRISKLVEYVDGRP